MAAGPSAAASFAPTATSDAAHDGEGLRVREATAVDERDWNPAGLQLGSDLRPGSVDDDDLVSGVVAIESEADRVTRDASAELEHEAHQVVYSAFRRT